MSTLKSSAEDLTLNADGSGNDVIIQSNASTVATVDSDKNLIIGATPKTFHANYNSIQGNNYTLTEDVAAGASKSSTWCYNAYIDAGNAWTYMNADEASQIQQYNGQVTIATAGVGSAEGDITFTNKLAIANAGDVTVSTGNLVIGTAGKGIDFSAQTSTTAGTVVSGGEVLDHYEEGNWTPAERHGNVTISTINLARYTKIGRVVHVFAYIILDSDGSAGSFELDGLPFNVASQGYETSIAQCSQNASGEAIIARAQGGTDNIYFTSALSQYATECNDIDGGHVMVSLTYTT